MEEINAILESEKLSSYLSSYSKEDEKMVVPTKQTKTFTDTKSRLLLRFNDDQSSASPLKNLQQRMVLGRRYQQTTEEQPPSKKYAKQAFDIDMRSYSHKEVNLFVRKGSRTEQIYEKHLRSNEEGHSFTYQSSNVTTVSKVKKERVRSQHNNDLLNQLNAEQWCPEMERTSPNQIENVSKLITLNNEHSNLDVDFQSMKKCLLNSSSAIKKFDLLQSLVLILSNQEAAERFATIQAIVDNDLFGVKCESGTGTILEDILWPVNITTPHPLQTSAAKLLNHLVSHEIGRDYFNGISLVKLLTWSSKEQIHDAMADNLIAVLKKLSLNNFQRHDMLANGLLQWLIAHMEAVEFSASTFQIDCMTDLLRVLMNVDDSRELASVNVPHLIIVLVRYLNVANEYAKVNVGHVLRALFLNEEAVEIGNKINLHRIIQDYIEKESNSKLRTDLQSIYESLVKYRENNLSRIDDGRRFSSTERLTYQCDRHDFNKDNDDPNEQLVCETDLMRKSACKYGNEEESRQKTQLPEKPNSQSLPVELKSWVLQLIRDKEFTESGEMERITAVDEMPVTDVNRGTVEILFSHLNSRLDQSSSLLSSGSQFSASKHNAIETLKLQSIEMNFAGDIPSVRSKDLTATSTPKSQSKKMYDSTTSPATEYSDLTSIVKDSDARNEILENDSFIDELCEKVFNRIRTKLAENYFCGTNCNTNTDTCCNNNC